MLYQPGSNGIIGVHSLSPAAALKVGNFEARFAGFDGKARLSEWHFMVDAQALQPAAQAGDAGLANESAALAPGGAAALPPSLFSQPISAQQEDAPPEALQLQDPAELPGDAAAVPVPR